MSARETAAVAASPPSGEEAPTATRGRALGPRWKPIVDAIALIFALFHLYTATWGILEGIQQRVIHLGFALVLIFLARPVGPRDRGNPGLIDLVMVLGVVVTSAYLVYEDKALSMRLGIAYERDVVLGTILVVILLEATRRVAGLALPLLAALAIAYAYFGPYMPSMIAHGGFTLEDITVTLYLTTEGIFGVPLAVSSAFIILFIILGAVLQASGASQFFSDVAYSLFGLVRGGPAKVAVVASGLFGMISGSAVANVSSTGVLTIPLMRRVGFSRRFAGAVEAVASSCGQFMPPIMASAAFVIAETVGVSYLEVAAAAAIPALLYYGALFVSVDLRAARLGLKGEARENLPSLGPALRSGGYLLLVPATLVFMMAVVGYSPLKAAVFTIVVNVLLFLMRELLTREDADPSVSLPVLVVALAVLAGVEAWMGALAAIGLAVPMLGAVAYAAKTGKRPAARFLWSFVKKIAGALRDGALGSLEVAAACATAGIIIGMLMLTGLGLRFSGLLIDIAGGSLPVLLVLTMLASIVLGMGMPTLGAYIVLAVLVVPSLVQMGVEPLAAHLFIFYFGVISAITPPVCMAAFAAASISGAHPMRTGVTAFRVGIAVFIIPFVMVYNPELILKGTVLEIVITAATALLGAAALAASLEGFILRPMRWIERGLALAGGLSLISGGATTDLVGFALIGGVLVLQGGHMVLWRRLARRDADPETPPSEGADPR